MAADAPGTAADAWNPIPNDPLYADPKVDACTNQLLAWAASPTALPADLDLSYCSAANIRRFAVAREGNFDAARDMLLTHLQWRVTGLPERLFCPACERNPHNHCFFPIGLDSERRPVFYSNIKKALFDDKEQTVQHMAHALENVWRQQAVPVHQQWVNVVDFGGFRCAVARVMSDAQVIVLCRVSDG